MFWGILLCVQIIIALFVSFILSSCFFSSFNRFHWDCERTAVYYFRLSKSKTKYWLCNIIYITLLSLINRFSASRTLAHYVRWYCTVLSVLYVTMYCKVHTTNSTWYETYIDWQLIDSNSNYKRNEKKYNTVQCTVQYTILVYTVQYTLYIVQYTYTILQIAILVIL